MPASDEPGVNTSATPICFSVATSAAGMTPPPNTQHVVEAPVAQLLQHPREQGEVGARQQRQPDGVDVLLQGGLGDLLGRLVQARCR